MATDETVPGGLRLFAAIALAVRVAMAVSFPCGMPGGLLVRVRGP